MAKKRNYDEANVVRSLMRKHSINISYCGNTRTIEVEKNAYDIGNGSWGKIDYLVKYCGYTVIYVAHIKKRNIAINSALIEEENIAPRINMVSMVKNTMKKYKI